ncbi:TVP38/TMEM64 family protein [Tuberibacillus sp. Marseille-P3662]|uniref:TVP38/TMEM64 family protein n=1 Tax=Tuberibacillus sp. Marseille-P3662 TaxID=1965358 RepID=UPI000A1CC93E|nr:TVP38/TMEM64 family protein [Tuberibacillus sp. Marseille-P3662]
MDFIHEIQEFFTTYVTEENIKGLLQGYRGLGSFLGIILPMLEAFFPILPLLAFVLANAAAYGYFLGFLLSWAGSCIGSIIVFWFFRTVAKRKLGNWLEKRENIHNMLLWVEKGGFGPVFIVLSIPFTPSSIINVVSGLSNMNPRSFILAVAMGKAIMVGIVSYFGEDWQEIIRQPVRIIVIIAVLAVLWVAGKYIERRLNKAPKGQSKKTRKRDRMPNE